MHVEVLSIWKKIPNAQYCKQNQALCKVRKYLIYLENSDKKKRKGKEGIYARGGGGGGGGHLSPLYSLRYILFNSGEFIYVKLMIANCQFQNHARW